jgi:Spy/CpxP family protein refolding chaperone
MSHRSWSHVIFVAAGLAAASLSASPAPRRAEDLPPARAGGNHGGASDRRHHGRKPSCFCHTRADGT